MILTPQDINVLTEVGSNVGNRVMNALPDPVVDRIRETKDRAAEVIRDAKDSVVETVLGPAKRVLDKAIPTALAACSSVQYTGNAGSFVDFFRPAYLSSYFQHIEADRHTYIGYPTHQIVQLGQLSGFCLCENTQVDIPGATVEELVLIREFLEGGFLIE